MFGPTAAIGLVELVAELKMMPDVEVSTYLHQSWPALVKDLDSLPPGTHTIVVGYSLGANSSVFVANSAKHVDLIVALQPSMLSWNPAIKGRVDRVVEIYNPDPWMTFGGMGSKKLVGGNIEYIANRDSHPGAQFNSEFRNLVKSEIAKFTTADRGDIAQAQTEKPRKVAQLTPPVPPASKEERGTRERKDVKAAALPRTAQIEIPVSPQRAKSDDVAADRAGGVAEEQKQQRKELTAFLDKLSGSVQSGYLFSERPLTVADQRPLEIDDQRPLTIADMRDYAERKYRHIVTASY
jgi:hypothetical protein